MARGHEDKLARIAPERVLALGLRRLPDERHAPPAIRTGRVFHRCNLIQAPNIAFQTGTPGGRALFPGMDTIVEFLMGITGLIVIGVVLAVLAGGYIIASRAKKLKETS